MGTDEKQQSLLDLCVCVLQQLKGFRVGFAVWAKTTGEQQTNSGGTTDFTAQIQEYKAPEQPLEMLHLMLRAGRNVHMTGELTFFVKSQQYIAGLIPRWHAVYTNLHGFTDNAPFFFSLRSKRKSRLDICICPKVLPESSLWTPEAAVAS